MILINQTVCSFPYLAATTVNTSWIFSVSLFFSGFEVRDYFFDFFYPKIFEVYGFIKAILWLLELSSYMKPKIQPLGSAASWGQHTAM